MNRSIRNTFLKQASTQETCNPWYWSNSAHAATNSAGSIPFGNSNGQNGEDNHLGTIWYLVFWACLITLQIKWTCGNHQLLSSAQRYVKASTASVPGNQYLELNLPIWVFLVLANLLIYWTILTTFWLSVNHRILSFESLSLKDQSHCMQLLPSRTLCHLFFRPMAISN